MNFTALMHVLIVVLCSILLPSLANGKFNTFLHIFLPTITDDLRATDVELIRARALTLYNLTGTGSAAVFPELSFTCSGSITSIWFIASELDNDDSGDSGDGGTIYPEFRLWEDGRVKKIQQMRAARYRGNIRDTRSPPSDGSGLHVDISDDDDISLYEYRLENPMHFEAGDVLGLEQYQSLLAVQSLSGGGVRNYVSFNSFNYIYLPNLGLDTEPLIALEGEHMELQIAPVTDQVFVVFTVSNMNEVLCLNGFLSVDALRAYMEVTRVNQNSGDGDTVQEVVDIPENSLSYVFPTLRVRETGFIEKWLFAADLVRNSIDPEPVSIEFQIWRNEGTQATAITATAITAPPRRSGHPNVYECTVDPPLSVQAGDYVGIQLQLPSYLRPLWIPDSGTAYHELSSSGGEISNLTIAGSATPLFAAQIRGNP